MSAEKKYRECAEAGMTQAECSRHLGVTREAVRQMANKHKIAFEDGKRVEEPIWERGMILLREGYRPQAVSRMIGVSSNLPGRWAAKIGIDNSDMPHDLARAKKIWAWRQCGETQCEIARRLGISQSNLSNFLQRYPCNPREQVDA